MTSLSNIEISDPELFLPPKIVMSVVHVELTKTVDIVMLAKKTMNAHYKKKRFAACIVRTPHGTGLYFSGGTIMITFGDLDLREAVEAAFMEKVRLIDPDIEKKSSKLVNTTVACGVNAKLYLNKIHRASKCEGDVKFVPELFPGMKKRVQIGDQTVTLTLFCSGKYNILGCKSKEEIVRAYKHSVNWLKDFIKVRVKRTLEDDGESKRPRID